jgi:hypothetical protein
MTSKLAVLTCTMFVLTVAAPGRSQSTSGEPTGTGSGTHPKAVHNQKQGRSAGGEMASGAGDIGKGTAKGAGSLAAGTGKGAVDLVTLHPINAATDVGKGGVSAGTHVGVGAVKGTAKIGKGVGKGIKHIF